MKVNSTLFMADQIRCCSQLYRQEPMETWLQAHLMQAPHVNKATAFLKSVYLSTTYVNRNVAIYPCIQLSWAGLAILWHRTTKFLVHICQLDLAKF